MTPEFHPSGAVILEEGGPPSERLFVIKKGGAKVLVRSADNEETLVDDRAQGARHQPLVNLVRFFALERGVRETGTWSASMLCRPMRRRTS